MNRANRGCLTGLDTPLLLLLLSAAGGVWIAYDKTAAVYKFALIALGLVLCAGLARIPGQIRVGKWEAPVLEWTLGSLPTLVAVYFFLTNDWASRFGKVAWLDPAMRWFAGWQPNIAGLSLNSNVIGGVIAAFLPLQVAALFQGRIVRPAWIAVALTATSALGLLMSASRGAWLALTLVAVGWGLWQGIKRRVRQGVITPPVAQAAWAIILATFLVSVALFLVLTPWGERLLALRSDRLTVWRNSLDLANDYAFTGLGLGNFEMAYSSYVLLVHVGHTLHAHNLYLDIWLEQGLVGLGAVSWIIIYAVWSIFRENVLGQHWGSAALASLGVILIHGLVDDAFYGYGGRAVFLFFLPLAVLTRSRTLYGAPHRELRRILTPTLLGGTVVLIVGISLLPGVQAAFKANIGAVAQTQIELSGYHWPESVFQDVVRRSAKTKLESAIAWYQSALESAPDNATANRRLGQIELSFGQLAGARSHLEAAYAAAPGQRATRQLLGECYALAGETGQAAALWRTIDVNEGQLELRQWWYREYLGERELAARMMQAQTALGQ